MSRTPQQNASAAFHERRKAAGWRKVTVWLDADTMIRLDELRDQEGSLDKAVAYAVRMSPTQAQVEEAYEL